MRVWTELNAMTEWAIRMFFRLSPICYLTWTTLQNFNTPSILSLPHYTKIHVSNTHSLSLSCDPSFVSFLARCRCRQSCTANTAPCQRGVINFSYSTKANDWQLRLPWILIIPWMRPLFPSTSLFLPRLISWCSSSFALLWALHFGCELPAAVWTSSHGDGVSKAWPIWLSSLLITELLSYGYRFSV